MKSLVSPHDSISNSMSSLFFAMLSFEPNRQLQSLTFVVEYSLSIFFILSLLRCCKQMVRSQKRILENGRLAAFLQQLIHTLNVKVDSFLDVSLVAMEYRR